MLFLTKQQVNLNFFKARWMVLVLLFTLTGWTLNVQRDEARTMTYVIPQGTSEQLAAGNEAVEFPSELQFTLGVRDILVIENQDNVAHTFGPFIIMPHSTLTKRFEKIETFESACSFHQDKQMTLTVNPAPWDIWRYLAGTS